MEKRIVYFVQETVRDNKGNYIVCLATENEKGYNLLDYNWGKDKALAEELAEEKNIAMGIDKKESIKIICSTMFCK